jgi:hypothetical protein
MLELAIVSEPFEAFVPSAVQEKWRHVSAVQESPGYIRIFLLRLR